MNELKQYFQISKVDADQRMVWGYASTEAVDCQGETVTQEAIKAAWDEYMQFGNVREMHQPSAVGIVKEYSFDDNGVFIGVYVVDDAAWNKVVETVYKGFSIGGKKLPGGYDPITKTITALKLTEISLVDRPANPEALITMWKADNLEDPTMPKEGEEVKPVDKLADLLAKGVITPERLIELAEGDINKSAASAVEPTEPEAVSNGDGVAKSVEVPPVPSEASASDAAALESASGDGNNSTGTVEQDATVKSDVPVGLVKLRESLKALAIGKGASSDDIKKGMWGVQDLASLINGLRWLQQDCAYEAEHEGDNSPLPAKLAAACATLCGILVEMVQEECSELLSEIGATSEDPVVMLGEMISRTEVGAELGKFSDALDVLKAGARNSKDDLGRIQKAHDLLSELGAACAAHEDTDAEKLHKAAHEGSIAKALGDFEKMAGELGELRKSFGTLQAAHDDLKKRYDALPTAPKGGLKVIEKGEDLAGSMQDAAPDAVAPVLKGDGSVDDVATMIKKVHAGGGRPLTGA